MNKRGDLPITILVIGIIVVCFFALLTFYMAENKNARGFNFAGKIALISSEMEKYSEGGITSITSTIEIAGKGKFLHFVSNLYNPNIDIRYYFPK